MYTHGHTHKHARVYAHARMPEYIQVRTIYLYMLFS